MSRFNHRSNWRVEADTPEVLVIRDLGPWDRYLSVTNDAEAVVEALAGRLAGRDLEYYDSTGRRDRLLVEGGKFAGFAPARRRA